jgi:hypothetical protein
MLLHSLSLPFFLGFSEGVSLTKDEKPNGQSGADVTSDVSGDRHQLVHEILARSSGSLLTELDVQNMMEQLPRHY